MLQKRLRALERAVFQQASVAEKKAKVTIFLPHNGPEPLSEHHRSGEAGIVIYESKPEGQPSANAEMRRLSRRADSQFTIIAKAGPLLGHRLVHRPQVSGSAQVASAVGESQEGPGCSEDWSSWNP